MLLMVLVALAVQPAPCSGEAAGRLAQGERMARAFDLHAAAEAYAQAAQEGCEAGELAATYLRALQAARDAYAAGGSPASLEAVRRAEADLQTQAARGQPVAAIARVVLMAAAAAAQSERDDMGTFLLDALHREALRVAAGEPGLPGVTAHEAAGELWLQVHRFDAARDAFREAERQIGMTPRIALGLARTAARLDDARGACDAYAALARLWGAQPDTPEIREARTALADGRCR